MKYLTKNILILINLIAAFGLCCAYLSNIVDPAKLWQFSFFGLAYPFLFLANIVFIVFWWWRKKRIALLSFFCIIIGFGNIGRYFQVRVPAKEIQTENSIKVLSYNVRVFNHFEWEEGISVRDSILEYMYNEDAGIVCMQEFLTRTNRPVQSEIHVKEKLSNTPYAHINYTIMSNQGATQFGLATFSKYPIVRRGVIIFENSPNSCIYTDIKKESDTVRIYNIHLQSIKLNNYDYGLMDSLFSFNSDRLDEMKAISTSLKEAFIKRSKQVRSIIQHMKESPYSIILCGDFNDTPVSYSYHQLLGDRKDAYREAGSGLSRTYRGKLPSYRIDYIFYSGNVSAITYKTGKIHLSDHYPVISILELDKTTAKE